MKVKRLHERAVLPTKAHAGDLGYDLYCLNDIIVNPYRTQLVQTGIAIQFPAGYGGFIKDRSSVATKKGLFTVAGVIDNGYTGEIQVAFHNPTEIPMAFLAGDKIAQLVLIPTVDFPIEEVTEVVSSDGRGQKGFGSTDTTPFPFDNYR